MQSGSRFSVFSCVKTRRQQQQTDPELDVARSHPLVPGLPPMRVMQASQMQRDFTQLPDWKRNLFPIGEQSRPAPLVRLGPRFWATNFSHDLGPRSAERCTGTHKLGNYLGNSDDVGRNGFAMTMVGVTCCEITA
jgi:hypothetical protein